MSKRTEAAGLVAGLLVLAIGMTYPIVRDPATRIAADAGDPVLTAWTLAWDADRLRHGLRGVWDAPNFFPYSHTLLYSDHLLGAAIFTAPLQWATGNPVLVYNVALIASFVLAGAGMYLLAREISGRRDAAAIAAVVFACQPFRTSHLSHLQWLLTGWLPLSLWALHRYFRTGRRRYLLACAVCYLLQALTASYFTYYALLPLAIVAAVEAWRARPSIRKLMVDSVPAVLLVAMVMVPVARGYYEVRRQQGLKRSSTDIVAQSARPGDYASAPPRLRLWGGIGSGRGEHELFFGAVAIALAAIAVVLVRRSPSVHLYAAVALTAVLLSFGPVLMEWDGRAIPGPYALLLRIVPGLDGLRAPARLAVVAQVAVAVLAAMGFARIASRLSRPGRLVATAAAAAAIVAEGWAAPISAPPFDRRGPPADRDAYTFLASLPSGAAIELPTGTDDIEREFAYQYMTIVHGHRIVNGHSGYLSPLAVWLRGGHSPFREADHQRDAIAMLRGIGVKYIVLHRDAFTDRSLADAMLEAIANDPLQIVAHRTFGATTVAVLTPLAEPQVTVRTAPVPAESIRASASAGSDRLAMAFDGDRDSRWLTGGHQSGSEWLQVDFDRARDVRVVRMQLGARSFGDYPRELAIDAIENGVARTVFRGSVLPMFARGIVRDGGDYVFVDVVLPQNASTALRLRQLGSTHAFFWSIHELQLLERI
jgi:hypothetical protein